MRLENRLFPLDVVTAKASQLCPINGALGVGRVVQGVGLSEITGRKTGPVIFAEGKNWWSRFRASGLAPPIPILLP